MQKQVLIECAEKDSKCQKLTYFEIISFIILDYIKLLGPKVFQYQKPFALKGDAVSSRCRQDSLKFLSSLKKFDLWALKSEIHIQIMKIKYLKNYFNFLFISIFSSTSV